MKVWTVEYAPDYEPVLDSIHATRQLAQIRADTMNLERPFIDAEVIEYEVEGS